MQPEKTYVTSPSFTHRILANAHLVHVRGRPSVKHVPDCDLSTLVVTTYRADQRSLIAAVEYYCPRMTAAASACQ